MHTPHAIVPSMYGVCKSRPESKRIVGAILLETRSTMTESGPIPISLSCKPNNDKKKRKDNYPRQWRTSGQEAIGRSS